MRALALTGARRLEVVELPEPELRAHEVSVRVTAVGLCGTDFHIFAGHANYNADADGKPIPLAEQPQVLGHEITGVVEEVGDGVRDLQRGDAVVIDQGRTCVSERRDITCEYCRTGDSHQCAYYREHGITGLPGGLAEYVSVPALNAIRINQSVDPAVAALTEPLGCVVHAIDRLQSMPARFRLGSGLHTAIVCGAGPAGLLFVQYLRNVIGFEGELLVTDPNAQKRQLAEKFGGHGLAPEDLSAALDGQRAELLIDASGAGEVFTIMPRVLRKQATIVLYGHGHAGVDMSVLNQVQFLEPTLVAPAGASGGFEHDGRPTTYVRSLSLIEQGKIDGQPLITHRYQSLHAVPAAFAGDHQSDGYIKGVVLQ